MIFVAKAQGLEHTLFPECTIWGKLQMSSNYVRIFITFALFSDFSWFLKSFNILCASVSLQCNGWVFEICPLENYLPLFFLIIVFVFYFNKHCGLKKRWQWYVFCEKYKEFWFICIFFWFHIFYSKSLQITL